MNDIGPLPDIEYLDEWLKKNARTELINWFEESCDPDTALNNVAPSWAFRKLVTSMEKDLIRKDISDFILPKDKAEISMTAASLTFAAGVSIISNNPQDWVSCGFSLAPIAKNIFERLGIIPMSTSTYAGPRFPFIWLTGKNPTWNSYAKIIASLKEEN